MNIPQTLVALATGAALLIASPGHAGGPVIIEETPLVEADTEDGRIPGWVVPVGILIIGALLIGGGDNCTCNDQPEDGGGSCGC